MQYFIFGTDLLAKSLFFPIEESPINSLKPKGGLWLTKYYPEYPNFNEWLDFLCIKPSYYFSKYGNCHKAAIVTLKDKAKIFNLDSLEKLNELKRKYSYHDYFSYQMISKDYDGIYIKIYSLNNPQFIEEFSVNSLILFNLDSIAYYQKAKVDLDPDFYENPESTYKIEVEEEKKYVLNDEIYAEIINKIWPMIYSLMKKNHLNYLKDDYSFLENELKKILTKQMIEPEEDLVKALTLKLSLPH